MGERPAPKKKKSVPERVIQVAITCVVARDGWRVAMRRRPVDGLLGGLWEFPEWDGDADPAAAEPLPEVPHVFSHFRAVYRPFVVRSADRIQGAADEEFRTIPDEEVGPAGAEPGESRWVHPDEFDHLALPVAQQKIARHVKEWLAERGETT